MSTTLPDRPVAIDEVPTAPSAQVVYGGRYAVENELGHGGMGRVLRARDLRIDRAVAIKVLAPGGERERFEQEARAAGALNHPNVVAVYDVGEHAGEPYIVTELLEGRTLRELLPVEPEKALDYAVQIASGLAAAHRKGIVHRDLKPENLFVTEDGRVKILDFGIARLADAGARTMSGAVLGTPAYMSPEQVRAERVDARSDVFSLGAVLYEMVSGHAPFLRGTALETAYAIVNDAPQTLPDSPLSRIVERCLEKDPGSRYADGGDVLIALGGTPARRRIRLRRRVVVIAAAMLISALALTLVPPRLTSLRLRSPANDLIAVFPFAAREAGQSAYLGEGMVDLLSTTLAGKTTRTVDANALLARLARDGWSPDPERGRAVAAQFGARRYVLGSVAETGSRLRIQATIYDADRGGAAVRQAAVEGDPAKVFDLVDELGAQLHGATAGDRLVRLADVTTSSRAALADYLEGVRQRRNLRLDESIATLQRAVAADPDFALARYELAYSTWAADGVTSELLPEMLRNTVALQSRLPALERDRLEAFGLFVDGRNAEAERRCREILRVRPDDVETHVLLGELLAHTGHERGVTVAEVRDALEETYALDPTNQETLVHLIEALASLGQYEQMAALIDRSIARTDPVHVDHWGWLRAMARHDEPTKRRMIDELRATKAAGPHHFWPALLSGDTALAEEFLDLPGPPRQIVWMRAAWSIVTGRLAAARKSVDAAARFNAKGENDLALWWDLVKFMSVDAAKLEADRRALKAFDTSALSDGAYYRTVWIGQLAAIAGDSAEAERSATELEQMRVGSPTSTAAADAAWYIRAHAAWRAGRAIDALALLDQIRGGWHGGRPGEPKWPFFWTNIEMLRGELLLSLGRDEEAERWFSTIPHAPFGDDWWMGPRLRRLAQIAERRGKKEKAIGYYQRFVELWKDCDPELRPQVNEARARLAALKG